MSQLSASARKSAHQPVLLNELLHFLKPRPNKNYIDATVNGGGMAEEILKANGPNGKLLGVDIDSDAINRANKRLSSFQNRFIPICDNFINLKQKANDYSFYSIDGIYLDLGVSSDQLEDRTRGLSFQYPKALLDMRLGRGSGFSARHLLKVAGRKELVAILQNYGEEPKARELAEAIVEYRKKKSITYAADLLSIVKEIYPKRYYRRHPATRLWQALRIAVNNELENLEQFLSVAWQLLTKEGRLVVISFHSLEDRIVKNFIRDMVSGGSAEQLTKKVVRPNNTEVTRNSRARSARLRAVIKK